MMNCKVRWNSRWAWGWAAVSLGLVVGCTPAPGGNGGDTNSNVTPNTNDNTSPNDNAPGNDNGNENGNGEPTWQTVVDAEEAALLAISGTSATDVYAVGADPGDGQGSLFIHYDGSGWSRLSSQTTDTLWWISEAPVDGVFFLSGDNGQIVEFDPTTQTITPHVTPSDTLRVFGTWGATRDDVWAVLSDESIGSTGGQIWHYDGNDDNEWTVYDFTEQFPGGFPGMIKIWGRNASEIYAVGALGTAFQYDGAEWASIDSGTTRTLFSVHGNAQTVGVAGGFNDGVLNEKTAPAAAFSAVSTIFVFQQNGVFYRDDFAASVGIDLSVYFREGGVWTLQTNTGFNDFDRNFHGPWVDPDGGVWAVGGQLDFEPLTDGILAYYGTETVATGSF